MEVVHHFVIQGKVQGVFFRDYTQRKAKTLGLKGTVRNRSDGSVEIYVQGPESQVKTMEEWCWEGSPYSRVTNVQSKKLELLKNYPEFRIVY